MQDFKRRDKNPMGYQAFQNIISALGFTQNNSLYLSHLCLKRGPVLFLTAQNIIGQEQNRLYCRMLCSPIMLSLCFFLCCFSEEGAETEA